MGNIGRSSTGCGLCRKRKIKCDEGKPGCKKCAQIRKPCPGYPFSIEFQLRPEAISPASRQPSVSPQPIVSSHSVQLLHTPRSDTSRASTPLIKSEIGHPQAPRPDQLLQTEPLLSTKSEPQEDSYFPLQYIPRTDSLSPTPPPRYDVQHQATCFFLNLFSFQASRLYGVPILDFLPDMLQNSNENSAVYQAAKAVSRMTLADRYSGHDVRLQTGGEYLKALKQTQQTMQDSSEAVKDESVIAVWLLGLYEAVNSVLSHGRDVQNRNIEEEFKSHIAHIRGAMHLLRLRGMSQFSNARSEKIFRIFKAAIQMRLFMLNSVTSRDFGNLELDVYADEHEFLPSETALRASKFFVRAARHLEKIKYALQRHQEERHSTDVHTELHQLLEEGESMDAKMEGWSKTELGWDMMRVRAPTVGTMWALYPSHALYYFYSFWVFLYWLRFLIARVKLFEGLIEIVKVQQEAPTDMYGRKASISHLGFKIEQYTTIIQLSAADLIGLTAYAMGDITNSGTFNSSLSSPNANRSLREVNVVAAMQLVIPLKVLQRSPYPMPRQKGAIDLAITHIGDGFRRQPIVA